ncbi:MAG: energy coupling factor transporter S component ThiW [Clostridiales bacterium]|jgi:energy coupling factor transporter S component ThiW|nr:energy coupling factor transporter S component ThiW [Clostridiales bacterium]
MKNKHKLLLRLIALSFFIAIGVVISPILRIEGMCPTAHLVNITCAVILGPFYALACSLATGILRMSLMGIPPLALTGSIFGALLSGILYKLSKSRIIWAVIGEILGTGIIGSIISYPIMAFVWGTSGISLFYYTPMFLGATIMGGTVAYILLKSLAKSGALQKIINNFN